MPKDKGPEWHHVVISSAEGDDGNKPDNLPTVQCIYCDKTFVGGAFRIRGHLIGDKKIGLKRCPKVPDSVVSQFTEIEDKRYEEQKKKQKLAALNQATSSASTSNKASFGKQTMLPDMIKACAKKEADTAIARMFFANGLAFNLAESRYFKEACAAVVRSGAGYVPPSRKSISTTLLDNEVRSVDIRVNSHLSDTVNTGLTMISDGWSNVQNRPLINFLSVTPEGAVFLGACDTSGEVKDSAYIAEKFGEQIEKVGADKVVQIITDSASNCVAARKLIAKKYPHTTCAPCAAHCVDLLLEDIGKLSWIASVIAEGHDVVKFITIHQSSLALFRSHSKLQLLKPGETRFATNVIMLQKLCECKDALQETVVSREYKQWLAKKPYHDKGVAVRPKPQLNFNSHR